MQAQNQTTKLETDPAMSNPTMPIIEFKDIEISYVDNPYKVICEIQKLKDNNLSFNVPSKNWTAIKIPSNIEGARLLNQLYFMQPISSFVLLNTLINVKQKDISLGKKLLDLQKECLKINSSNLNQNNISKENAFFEKYYPIAIELANDYFEKPLKMVSSKNGKQVMEIKTLKEVFLNMLKYNNNNKYTGLFVYYDNVKKDIIGFGGILNLELSQSKNSNNINYVKKTDLRVQVLPHNIGLGYGKVIGKIIHTLLYNAYNPSNKMCNMLCPDPQQEIQGSTNLNIATLVDNGSSLKLQDNFQLNNTQNKQQYGLLDIIDKNYSVNQAYCKQSITCQDRIEIQENIR